jgi:hypothetical protein
MKVNIGPYKSWTGPYQLADMVFFWQDKYSDTCLWAQRAHKLGTWLAHDKHGNDSYLMKLCNWIQSKRTRKISVKIDYYDTWGMDSTLGLIVLPMLKQLHATNHGAPFVDDSDVPEHLRSIAPGARDGCEFEWDTDANHFLRWDWVLSEMIWAFEQKVNDESESQFYDHGEPIAGENVMESIKRVKIDYDGLQAWQARKTNGFRLFGKYYENLWD